MVQQDTIKLLRECDAGIKMGVASIDDVLDHVRSGDFRNHLNRCKDEHDALKAEIQTLLDRYHDEGKDPNPIAKGMSWMKTNMKLGMEESDATIADLMTDGCNMGVKSLNRYLDYSGHSELRFNRGRSHDLRNMRFGYLTALEPTGERSRKDIVWLCRCECGKECKVPAASLVSGNTFSCGCLRGEHFKEINRYIDGTSLRQSIEEKVLSPQAESGYTGVTKKRGKWRAYIKYKGHEYTLGCYSKLEDAVKATVIAHAAGQALRSGEIVKL